MQRNPGKSKKCPAIDGTIRQDQGKWTWSVRPRSGVSVRVCVQNSQAQCIPISLPLAARPLKQSDNQGVYPLGHNVGQKAKNQRFPEEFATVGQLPDMARRGNCLKHA
jgi:hypothetical protein